MEKRAFERIPTNIYSRFIHDRILCTGIVTNLSKNGMQIKTRARLPLGLKFEVLFPLIADGLKVSARVNRVIKTDDRYGGVGLELLGQPKKYFEVVDSLRAALFILKYPLSNVM